MSIRVVTDSNCDLPGEIIEKHRIVVVPLYINIGTDNYLDGIDMSRQEFYERLPKFTAHPKTAVPGTDSFVRAYQGLAAEGATEILSVHISSSLSAITDVARLAAKEVKGVAVTVFDSGQLTLGTGLLVVAAADAAAENRSLPEIVALLEDQASRTYCFAALDTLEFLRRSGRLSRFQSSLGSILRIKPLLKMHRGDFDMERVRTRKAALSRVIELTSALGPLEELALVHTHAPDEAEALARKASHLIPEGKVPMSAEVTPVIGAHIGPGAVGFVAIQARDRS
jgi:DegV family protein with EDD domain